MSTRDSHELSTEDSRGVRPGSRLGTRSVLWLRLGFAWVVAVFFSLVAVGKLFDWNGFLATIDSYAFLPHWFGSIAALVPAAEAVPFSLLIIGRVGVAMSAALGMLVAFSTLLALEWAYAEPPDCACLGVWAQYLEVEQGVKLSLVRNAVLGALTLASLILHAVFRKGTLDAP